MNIEQARMLGIKLLRAINIDTPELDMRIMLCQVLQYSELNLFLEQTKLLSHEQWDELMSLLKRRLCYEPLAYISGIKEF